MDGTIIILYFGGSNTIFADCNQESDPPQWDGIPANIKLEPEVYVHEGLELTQNIKQEPLCHINKEERGNFTNNILKPPNINENLEDNIDDNTHINETQGEVFINMLEPQVELDQDTKNTKIAIDHRKDRKENRKKVSIHLCSYNMFSYINSFLKKISPLQYFFSLKCSLPCNNIL